MDITSTDSLLNMDRTRFPISDFSKDGNLRLVQHVNFKYGINKIINTTHNNTTHKSISVNKSNPGGNPGNITKNTNNNFFVENTTLGDKEQSYCKCVLKVASKQPESCLTEKAWFKKRDGKN